MTRRDPGRPARRWRPAAGATAGLVLLLAGPPAFAGGDPVAGEAVAGRCQACHGSDGNSPSPLFPHLAGQYEDYLLKTLEDYRSGAREDPVMRSFAEQLSEEEMADVAAFYATQESGLFTIELTR